jgi:hypothetical protein
MTCTTIILTLLAIAGIIHYIIYYRLKKRIKQYDRGILSLMKLDHIGNYPIIERLNDNRNADLKLVRNIYGFYAYINCLNDEERDIELWKYDLTHNKRKEN